MIRSFNRERRSFRSGLFHDRSNVTYEVSWGRFSLGGKLSTSGEETIDVRLDLGAITVYLAAELRRRDGRQLRLPSARIDACLYWYRPDLWFRFDLGEYDHAHARGMRLHLLVHTGRLKNRLLGKTQYAAREVKRAISVVPLPEGGVPCEIVWEEATWKRPRWPRTTKVLRADVTPERPIGTPGKGENSWDCGDDATHSITGPVKTTTAREAVLMLTSSVLRDREKYGGTLAFAPQEARHG